jgi:hypothetical protein
MRNKIVIGVMGVLLSCGGLAQAEPITIQITGNVTSLGGYTEAIPSSIYAGVTFTGTYTYDSSAVDGGGGHHWYDAPYGIDLFLGGYEFKTAPDQVGKFDMWIMNDLSGNGVWDYYRVCGYQNVSTPSVDFASSTEWDLGDSTHTALSSAELPVTAPILTDWDYNVLKIRGAYGPDLYGLTIYGTVTQVQLIPEPLTGALMATGLLLLRRRR